MSIRKHGALILGFMTFLAMGILATAQTVQEGQQVIKAEVKVVSDGKTMFVTPSDMPHQSATFTFVASEMGFESKVVKGIPFSADAVTEFTQVLSNGQRINRKSASSIYRDSEGRTRREQTISAIGPFAATGPGRQTVIINDPVAGVSYVLNLEERTAVKAKITGGSVVSFTWSPSPSTGGVVGGVVAASGTSTAGTGAVTMAPTPFGVHRTNEIGTSTNSRTETLPAQMIEGVMAEGTRTIETIPAGAIGNDSPIEIVSERWFAAELGMVVRTRKSDPMSGENVYQLTNIRRGEPAPTLFQVPPDFTIKETAVKVQQTIKKDSNQ